MGFDLTWARITSEVAAWTVKDLRIQLPFTSKSQTSSSVLAAKNTLSSLFPSGK